MLKRLTAALLALILCGWIHGDNTPAVHPFITDGENVPVGFNASLYDPTANTTWFCWTSASAGSRFISAQNYNQGTKLLSAEETVGVNPNNDQHGWPSCLMDQYGFVHYFWGSHNSALKYSWTTTARSITGGFTAGSDIGSSYTFSQPFLVNGKIYVLSNVGGGPQDINIFSGTPSPSGGVSSWSAPTQITNAGGSDFMFAGNATVVGHSICFPITYSPTASYRQDTYYGCYSTDDSSFKNAAGSASTLPVSVATLQANYTANLTSSPSTSNTNIWPIQATDNGGTVHVFFTTGPESGTEPIWESHWNGSAWTSALSTGCSQVNWNQDPTALATTDGGLDLYCAPTQTTVAKVHYASGSFGTLSQIFLVTDATQTGYCLCWLLPVQSSATTFDLFFSEAGFLLGTTAFGNVVVYGYSNAVVP